MSPSVPNPPTPSHVFRVKAKVLTASKAPLHLPTCLISLTSAPLTHSQPCWPPRSHAHTRTHTHTHTRWPPCLLSPLPGTLFSRSPLSSLPHHLQISTQMSPPQQGPSPPAHFKYHSLPQLSQFLSSSSIYPQDFIHTHTHTHTPFQTNVTNTCNPNALMISTLLGNPLKSSRISARPNEGLFKIYNLLIYMFWLCWVFVAACRLSLVVARGGYSSLWCSGFPLWGFSCCGAQAPGTQAAVVTAGWLNSCGLQA